MTSTEAQVESHPSREHAVPDAEMSPIRLLVMIDRFHPIIGGAQKNIHELGRRLGARGFRITVLTRRLYPETAPEEVIDGIRVLRVGHAANRILSKLKSFVLFAGHVVSRRADYDLVMCVPCSKVNDLLPMIVAHPLSRVPYVVRATGMVDIFDSMFEWKTGSVADFIGSLLAPPFVWRRVYRSAAALVVQSKALEDRAARYGLDSLIIPNGADTERFRPASPSERRSLRATLGLPDDKVIVIATGRYTRPKNQITLIKAVRHVEERVAPGRLFLLVLGATERQQVTSNEEELKAYVRDERLSGYVQLMNDVANVEDYLRASDVYAMPSYSDEGMSNALVEAMATGLPVVSSNIPQNVAVLPADGALFFDPLDADTLGAHLAALVDSEERRSRMGEANLGLVEASYDNRRLSGRYAELLSRIARTGRAPA